MVTGGRGWSWSHCPETSWRLPSTQPELIRKRSPVPELAFEVGPRSGGLGGRGDFELVAWFPGQRRTLTTAGLLTEPRTLRSHVLEVPGAGGPAVYPPPGQMDGGPRRASEGRPHPTCLPPHTRAEAATRPHVPSALSLFSSKQIHF